MTTRTRFAVLLISTPMLAFVLPISTAVSVTTALTAITSVHHLGRGWRRVAWRHFAFDGGGQFSGHADFFNSATTSVKNSRVLTTGLLLGLTICWSMSFSSGGTPGGT